MKKALLLMSLFLIVAVVAFGAEFGAIKGVVKDADGQPLPGINVTLSGSKIVTMSAVTSDGGHFRFLNLPVASDYNLKLEISGFKTHIQEDMTVTFGKDINLAITMEMTTLQEEVVVVGRAPVIDTKRVQVSVNISNEMIMGLPTARNPWVLLEMMPGMLVDKSDVGGSEGGQQSNYIGNGTDPVDSTWNVDGANITDNSALGATPAYLNPSLYDEIQITYGNNDIGMQTGGVQINLITRRGGNKYSGSFFMDVERNAWQSDNVPEELSELGYTAAGVNRFYLYGANFGGPIVKDRAWFYGSWGVQDIEALTLSGSKDRTWLLSGYFRTDVQITDDTRFNGFVQYDNKNKWGRAYVGYTQQDPDTLWDQIGPGYIYKGELEQIFGNLYLNAKAIYTDNMFNLKPQKQHTADGSGDYMIWAYDPSFYMSGNTIDYGTGRDSINVNVTGLYFQEDFLGADHEFKFGADYMSAQTSTFNLYESDILLESYGPNPDFPTGEEWYANLFRDYIPNYSFERYSLFAQDNISIGNFAITLGLRYDQETSTIKNVDIPSSQWLPQYMPGLQMDEFKHDAKWQVFSPRFSVSWDMFGTGKDVLKFSVARYGSQSGNNIAYFIDPLGWTYIYLAWQDLNSDTRVTGDELFGYDWDTGELKDPNDPTYWINYASTINLDNPTSVTPLNQFDPNYNSPLMDEVSLFYEKEIIPDFAGRIELFYKKYHKRNWYRSMMADGTLETEDNYYVAGQDETTGYDYYGRTELFPYQYLTNHDKAFDRYLGAQIVFEKRLSNNWMMTSSFGYSDWRRFYKGEYLGRIDDMLAGTTNFGLTNEEYFDGGVVAPESQGSGIEDLHVNSRWTAKFSGLYKFPFGINFSGVFMAREGYVIPTYTLVNVPGIGQTEIYGSPDGEGKYGDERLPNYYVLNLRLEKSFQVSDNSTVVFAADAFNVSNAAHSLKKEAQITAPNFNQDLLILNPRVFKFSIRYNF